MNGFVRLLDASSQMNRKKLRSEASECSFVEPRGQAWGGILSESARPWRGIESKGRLSRAGEDACGLRCRPACRLRSDGS
jgi:hypothetical protein